MARRKTASRTRVRRSSGNLRHLLLLGLLIVIVFVGWKFLQAKKGVEGVNSNSFNLKVLAIGFNPTDGATTVADRYFGWTMNGRTATQLEDYTFNNAVSTFSRLSNNVVNYQIVKKINLTSFPRYSNGQTLTANSYGRCTSSMTSQDIAFCDSYKHGFDHAAWVTDNNICQIARENNVDEIWVMSLPYVMTWESFMIGPREGFGVNGPTYTISGCDRQYIVMNPNYNSAGNFFHNYGHRIEATMSYLVDSWRTEDRKKYWVDFASWDMGSNGGVRANPTCGNAHLPANGTGGYDYSNQTTKTFSCPDWKNFPNLTGATETINCSAWGCVDIGWQEHWLGSLPRSEGEVPMVSKGGKQFTFQKNWWKYILFPENAILQRKIQLGIVSAASIDLDNSSPTPTRTSTATPTMRPGSTATPTKKPTPTKRPTSTPRPTKKPTPTPTPRDTTPPAVSISSPSHNSNVVKGQITQIGAAAEDGSGIRRVEFYVNSVRRCADSSSPYTCRWRVSRVKATSTYTLTVRATDKKGNRKISEPITVNAVE